MSHLSEKREQSLRERLEKIQVKLSVIDTLLATETDEAERARLQLEKTAYAEEVTEINEDLEKNP